VDEESCFRDGSLGNLLSDVLSNRSPLGKTGAPYDLFLRSDMANIKKKVYKVIWLQGILDLTHEEIGILKHWQQEGASIIWTKNDGTYLDVYTAHEVFLNGTVKLSAQFLQDYWKKAGVHIYLNSNDVLYIGHSWLCIHSVEGGKRNISFPVKISLTDPATGKILKKNADKIELDLAPGSTVLYHFNIYSSPAN
jgi:beta-galactosidase